MKKTKGSWWPMGSSLFVILALATAIWLGESTTTTPPKPEPAPVEIPQCDLDCMVDERAVAVYERDQADYRRQARLKALIEIQEELHLITIEYAN